jgi:hypothetical protein
VGCSSSMLLGRGAPVSTSPLFGEVVGCTGTGCSVDGPADLELPTAFGSTSEAALRIFSIELIITF